MNEHSSVLQLLCSFPGRDAFKHGDPHSFPRLLLLTRQPLMSLIQRRPVFRMLGLVAGWVALGRQQVPGQDHKAKLRLTLCVLLSSNMGGVLGIYSLRWARDHTHQVLHSKSLTHGMQPSAPWREETDSELCIFSCFNLKQYKGRVPAPSKSHPHVLQRRPYPDRYFPPYPQMLPDVPDFYHIGGVTSI